MPSKRILVVEDDPTGREVIADFLTAHGYTVKVATNGDEALELWRQERPDLVVADVLLPRKNGFEVCFEIKRTEAGARTPVLLISAVCTDAAAELYAATGVRAQGYLTKPFKMRQLLARVRELLAA